MVSILEKEDYFHCNRFKCTMLKTRCADRQEMRHRDLANFAVEAIFARFPECQNCEQGKVIWRELNAVFGAEAGPQFGNV